MTDSNYTHIGILVDRSGSMFSVLEDTEGGLKTFLDEQAKAPGEVKISLAQFDNEYEQVFENVTAEEAKKYRLVPRASTALLDACGKFITDLGATFNSMTEDQRPGKVIVVILTDGAENSSREWTQLNVKKLIKQQTDVYKWEFVFLGANIDAVSVAGGIGIARGSAITYDANNTAETISMASSYVMNTRNGVKTDFTDEELVKAMGDKK